MEKEGWRLKLLSFSSHIGTHVNVPSHMVETGKTLDDITLDNFVGECVIYKEGVDFSNKTGVIFRDSFLLFWSRLFVPFLRKLV